MFRHCTMVLGAVCTVFCAGSASATVAYTATDLGALGGTESYAYGVNNSGQVVGWANFNPAIGNEHAFLYAQGTMTDLGTLGGTYSDAYGINTSGQIVGTAATAVGGRHAFSCNGSGSLQDISQSPFITSAVAVSVNSDGKAVGYVVRSGSPYSVLFSGGTVSDISSTLPPSPNNAATDINDKGQIVGWRSDYNGTGSNGYLYSGGTATTLAGVWTCEAINNSGQVVGASDPNGDIPSQPILYQNGTLQNLTVPAGFAGGWAHNINNHGQIVGSLLTAAWQDDGGFLYSDGVMENLQSLISSSSGWTMLTPTAISDDGFIVGQGRNASGQLHAFLLTPTPEPSTLALLGISAISLLAFACRRRRNLHNLPSMILAAMVVLAAGSVQADVFNMGGTLDPTTGTWTGQASLEFVTVGNPGNAADPSTGFGSVGYTYAIGKYDVTNAQYAAFLTAKATSSDPYGLWNSDMSGYVEGGINRSGSGPYTYTIKSGMANMPVVDVTWFDTLRFANWLNNGQGNGSTETGSYTLLGGTPTPSNASTISRNPGAQWFLPSENEWYKAAYYDPTLNSGSGGYWLYPTRSNTAPVNILSSTGTNNANFRDEYYGTGTRGFTTGSPYLTDVGAFAASPGPYGTFDQGGDVWQWNEANISGDGSSRGLRGGGWEDYSDFLAASTGMVSGPTDEECFMGFRVASVPEPGSVAMLLAGAIGLLRYAWRRRQR